MRYYVWDLVCCRDRLTLPSLKQHNFNPFFLHKKIVAERLPATQTSVIQIQLLLDELPT